MPLLLLEAGPEAAPNAAAAATPAAVGSEVPIATDEDAEAAAPSAAGGRRGCHSLVTGEGRQARTGARRSLPSPNPKPKPKPKDACHEALLYLSLTIRGLYSALAIHPHAHAQGSRTGCRGNDPEHRNDWGRLGARDGPQGACTWRPSGRRGACCVLLGGCNGRRRRFEWVLKCHVYVPDPELDRSQVTHLCGRLLGCMNPPHAAAAVADRGRGGGGGGRRRMIWGAEGRLQQRTEPDLGVAFKNVPHVQCPARLFEPRQAPQVL